MNRTSAPERYDPMRAWIHRHVLENPLLWHEWQLNPRRRWWRSPLTVIALHTAATAAVAVLAWKYDSVALETLVAALVALPQLILWTMALGRSAQRELTPARQEELRLTLLTRADRDVAHLWSYIFAGWLITSVEIVLFNLLARQHLVCVFFLPVPTHVTDILPGLSESELILATPLQVGAHLLVLAWGRRLLQQFGRERDSLIYWFLATLWFPALFFVAGSWVVLCGPQILDSPTTWIWGGLAFEAISIIALRGAHRRSVARTQILDLHR